MKVVSWKGRSAFLAVAFPLSTLNTTWLRNVHLAHITQMSLAELLRRLCKLALYAEMHFWFGLCTRSAPPLWLFVVSETLSDVICPLFCADLATTA